MTDSPAPRRHRGSRRAPRRSRGLFGPIASALSVLLAIGPVVWLMTRDTSTVDAATKVLNVSEDTRGENIAAGYDSAQKVVAAWMNSEGHRQNILNCRFTSIGIGYDPGRVRSDWGPGSWVQDFGRS
jgi:Cysteine-rich secretory protein family